VWLIDTDREKFKYSEK